MVSGSKSNDRPTGLPSDLIIAVRADFRPVFSVLPKGREWRVLLVALLAAILLHLTAIMGTLLEWPDFFARKLPPPEIPVELIFEEPPQTEAPTEKEQPPIVERESGGDPSLAQGRVVQAAPTPAAPAEPATPRPAEVVAPLPEPMETHELAEFPPPQRKPTPPSPPAPVPPKEVEAPPAPPKPAQFASVTQGPKPPTHLTILGQGGGDAYLNQLQAMIERQRSYPAIGSPMMLSGLAVYELRLARTGEVLSVILLRSTGVGVLDQEGQKIVRRAGPFPPVPADMPGSPLVMRLDLPIYP